MYAIQPCALLRELLVCRVKKTRSVKKTALGRRAGRKNESGWEVICGERASGELKEESSETSGAKEKARMYGREKLADAS